MLISKCYNTGGSKIYKCQVCARMCVTKKCCVNERRYRMCCTSVSHPKMLTPKCNTAIHLQSHVDPFRLNIDDPPHVVIKTRTNLRHILYAILWYVTLVFDQGGGGSISI